MSVAIRAQIKPDAPTPDLWQIAETGDIEQLEQVLARGAEVNVSNDSGVTPLMVAAYHGKREMVQELIEHGADLNAADNDGFTAGMLADHAGHEDVVRTLVALGVKRTATAPATETSPIRVARQEASDVAPPIRNPEVRTLHDPPEIWDLVHETRTEFHPRSAFVTHLTSSNPLVLGAIALIIGGGAVFGFMKLRGRSESAPAAPSVRAEDSNTKTASSSQASVPNRAASPAQEPTNTPASTEIAGSRVDPGIVPNKIASPPIQQATTVSRSADIAGRTVDPNITDAAPTALPGRRVVAKPPRQNPTRSGTTGRMTVAGTVNKDKAQESMTLGRKSDNEKRGDPTVPTVAKKESDKAPSPTLIAPAKGSPSPRGKVIKWP
jgi:cytoskeletal protein RodZ